MSSWSRSRWHARLFVKTIRVDLYTCPSIVACTCIYMFGDARLFVKTQNAIVEMNARLPIKKLSMVLIKQQPRIIYNHVLEVNLKKNSNNVENMIFDMPVSQFVKTVTTWKCVHGQFSRASSRASNIFAGRTKTKRACKGCPNTLPMGKKCNNI